MTTTASTRLPIWGWCLLSGTIGILIGCAGGIGLVSGALWLKRSPDKAVAVTLSPNITDKEKAEFVNEMPWTLFFTEHVADPKVFTLDCRLHDHFRFRDHLRGTHHSMHLENPTGTWTPAFSFIPRNSKAGQQITEVFQDGKAHRLIIRIERVGDINDHEVIVHEIIRELR